MLLACNRERYNTARCWLLTSVSLRRLRVAPVEASTFHLFIPTSVFVPSISSLPLLRRLTSPQHQSIEMESSSCLLERHSDQMSPAEPKPRIWPTLRRFSPFSIISSIRRAWRDYKLGRKLRQEGYEAPGEESETEQTATGTERPKRPNREPGWTFRRDSEYPWKIKRSIQGDIDWRGTWALEVKDIFEVSWVRQKVHDGRRWRWVTLPNAPHWPLPHQDSRPESRSKSVPSVERESGRVGGRS